MPTSTQLSEVLAEALAIKKAKAAERKARWKANHPEAERSYNRAYYEINRSKVLAKYRQKHPRSLPFQEQPSEAEAESILIAKVFADTFQALSPAGKQAFKASLEAPSKPLEQRYPD